MMATTTSSATNRSQPSIFSSSTSAFRPVHSSVQKATRVAENVLNHVPIAPKPVPFASLVNSALLHNADSSSILTPYLQNSTTLWKQGRLSAALELLNIIPFAIPFNMLTLVLIRKAALNIQLGNAEFGYKMLKTSFSHVAPSFSFPLMLTDLHYSFAHNPTAWIIKLPTFPHTHSEKQMVHGIIFALQLKTSEAVRCLTFISNDPQYLFAQRLISFIRSQEHFTPAGSLSLEPAGFQEDSATQNTKIPPHYAALNGKTFHSSDWTIEDDQCVLMAADDLNPALSSSGSEKNHSLKRQSYYPIEMSAKKKKTKQGADLLYFLDDTPPEKPVLQPPKLAPIVTLVNRVIPDENLAASRNDQTSIISSTHLSDYIVKGIDELKNCNYIDAFGLFEKACVPPLKPDGALDLDDSFFNKLFKEIKDFYDSDPDSLQKVTDFCSSEPNCDGARILRAVLHLCRNPRSLILTVLVMENKNYRDFHLVKRLLKLDYN